MSLSRNHLKTRERGARGYATGTAVLLYRKRLPFLSDLVPRLHISGFSRQGFGALGRWHLLLVQLLKRLHENKRAWEGFLAKNNEKKSNARNVGV